MMKHVLSTGAVLAFALSVGGCGLGGIFNPTPMAVQEPLYEPVPVSETVSPEPQPAHHTHAMGHDAVAKIQQALQDKGYYWGKVDGINGSGTRNAVSAFQHDLGVPMTGVVGHKEWSSLGL